MAPAKGDPAVLGGGPQRPAFGPAIWGWGLACGVVLWTSGFLILPWWAAVFLWWWPSILFGAALGLATIGFAKWLARATGVSDRASGAVAGNPGPGPSGEAGTLAASEPLGSRQAAVTAPTAPGSTPG
jgi:hypothetical protein